MPSWICHNLTPDFREIQIGYFKLDCHVITSHALHGMTVSWTYLVCSMDRLVLIAWGRCLLWHLSQFLQWTSLAPLRRNILLAFQSETFFFYCCPVQSMVPCDFYVWFHTVVQYIPRVCRWDTFLGFLGYAWQLCFIRPSLILSPTGMGLGVVTHLWSLFTEHLLLADATL